MKRISLLLFGLLGLFELHGQTITKLTITDNLAASSKFGYGKPKPAEAKDLFQLQDDKGTQVLFYADLNSADDQAETYRLVFTAYKLLDGKEEWVDERSLDMKKTSTYALTAVNFFEPGNYKIKISRSDDSKKILSEGLFRIEKN